MVITSRMGSIADNEVEECMDTEFQNSHCSKSLANDLAKRYSCGYFHPGLVSTDMIGGNGDISPRSS